MTKKIILLTGITALLLLQQLYAQNIDNDRNELKSLLQERKLKFEVYTNSLDKRTGFFGNKTKKDLEHSNEILIKITELDNRIISTLNRVVDFKNYEKISYTYDVFESKNHLTNLLSATDTLSKQVKELSYLNSKLQIKNQKLKYFFYIMSILPTLVILFIFRKKIIGLS